MNWRPSATLETLQLRAELFASAREFLNARELVEVDTPHLGAATVTEPNIASLGLRVGPQKVQRWLQTSPEYYMKRLLAAGSPDIFQLGKVFRADELGKHHLPEFTLLEWYRRGFSLAQMAHETVLLLTEVAKTLTRKTLVTRQVNYADAFSAEVGLNPLEADDAQLHAAARQTAPDINIERESAGSRSILLDLLFSHRVVPSLEPESIITITHFPATQAALARLCPEDDRVAERFEVFFGGVELANGYRELTDADVQAQRFEHDRTHRKLAGLAEVPVDQALLAALQAGLPECSGVAVGMDRVLLTLLGLKRLDEVVSFAEGW